MDRADLWIKVQAIGWIWRGFLLEEITEGIQPPVVIRRKKKAESIRRALVAKLAQVLGSPEHSKEFRHKWGLSPEQVQRLRNRLKRMNRANFHRKMRTLGVTS
jgi:hypothetical protein